MPVARDGLKFAAGIGEAGFGFRDKLADGAQGPEMCSSTGAWQCPSRGHARRIQALLGAAGSAAFAGKDPSCRDRESIFRSSKKRSWENPDITQDDSHPWCAWAGRKPPRSRSG